ncbi:MAG: hypothetical protein IKZ41_09045 [Clostridia bacterium]|nr:hypothetical protein [Clostridia bacterium]MBR5364760.1 hypothetical protein [Clostridia bacterium]
MKKYLALFLALLLLALSLFSCSNTTNKEDEEQTPVPTADPSAAAEPEETDDPNARIDSGLAPADYDAYTFNIFIHNTITNDFEAEEITGEPVNDAEYERMIAVQDKANCEIVPLVVAADNRQGQKPLGTSVQAGTNDYDLACLSGYSSCNALVEGYLTNLFTVENLDLTKPWWDQYCTEECTFKDAVYQMTGDLSIGDNKATFCYFFNKNMAETYNLPNFYEMVDNFTWTIDNFRQFAEAVDTNLDFDNDGNHINDKEDIYGIYIWDDIMMGIVNASGIKCCTINADGNLELTLYSEKFVNAFDKFTAYAYNKDVTCAYQRNGYDADWGQIAFREGRALFYLANIGAATSFRDMEDDFGILSLPLYDETQNRYYNSAASWSVSLYSIPKNSYGTDGLARAGWITEALAYESMYSLTPAYYEQTLQNKVSRDEESARMLDLIFASRTYDFGWYFEIGGYNEGVMNLLRAYSTDVSSMVQRNEKMANKILKKYNEKIAEQMGN